MGWVRVKGPVAPPAPPRPQSAPTPPLGQVAIQAVDGAHLVVGELGKELPKISDGFGGFQTVDRTARVGLTWWSGRNPAAVQFAIRFDNRETHESVEAQIRALEALGGVRLGDSEPTPDIVFNANGMVPLDQTDPDGTAWVWNITAPPDPQEEERDDGTGERFVGEYNLTLTRAVTDPTLTARSDAEAARIKQKTPKSGPKVREYTSRAGDTWVGIAAREYGNVDRWQEIAAANPTGPRDPRAPLRPGTKVRLPQ